MAETSTTVRCPSCNYRLAKTTDELRRLAAENKMLRNEVMELEEILESIEVHSYVATPSGTCFHRPQCKWLREIPSSYLTEFYSHAEAAAVKKPCKTCRA
jgi:hypothetical protein